MASLYIKDAVTAGRVDRMARQRGTTKTALVARALDALEKAEPAPVPVSIDDIPPTDFVEWMRWHRARNPLPPPTGRKADKAFFDRMWGEPD